VTKSGVDLPACVIVIIVIVIVVIVIVAIITVRVTWSQTQAHSTVTLAARAAAPTKSQPSRSPDLSVVKPGGWAATRCPEPRAGCRARAPRGLPLTLTRFACRDREGGLGRQTCCQYHRYGMGGRALIVAASPVTFPCACDAFARACVCRDRSTLTHLGVADALDDDHCPAAAAEGDAHVHARPVVGQEVWPRPLRLNIS
jgi:hypothetical protein